MNSKTSKPTKAIDQIRVLERRFKNTFPGSSIETSRQFAERVIRKKWSELDKENLPFKVVKILEKLMAKSLDNLSNSELLEIYDDLVDLTRGEVKEVLLAAE